MNFVQAVRNGLEDCLHDRSCVILSQLGKYGLGGLTAGLHQSYPAQMITMPVAENLMNGAAFGMALAGMRPIVIHERMDFLAVGMDPLVNHIPVWQKRDHLLSLPLVIMAVVGKGHGQGPQHSKNFTHWFRGFEGWTVAEPDSPEAAREALTGAIRGDSPVLYVLHREVFKAEGTVTLPRASTVGLCGASEAFERDYYQR
jgi:pyruvate/2-oxoglutarate/acetoin dehydrogenase E1 component